jgi:cytidylate kinase
VELDEPTVLEDVRRRDHLDTTRDTSPLRVAAGAVVIDSSQMEAEDVVEQIVRLVEALRAASA